MSKLKTGYPEFYRHAWRENVYGTSNENINLSAAEDSHWVSFSLALQAFEKAHEWAVLGHGIQESKELYLAQLEGRTTPDDALISPNEM